MGKRRNLLASLNYYSGGCTRTRGWLCRWKKRGIEAKERVERQAEKGGRARRWNLHTNEFGISFGSHACVCTIINISLQSSIVAAGETPFPMERDYIRESKPPRKS